MSVRLKRRTKRPQTTTNNPKPHPEGKDAGQEWGTGKAGHGRDKRRISGGGRLWLDGRRGRGSALRKT